jgi:RimJ/RimL family protein N-acetyltransferase
LGRSLTTIAAVLSDDVIRLAPLTAAHESAVTELVHDEAVVAFTRFPTEPSPTFVREWIDAYERGLRDGSRAAFAIESLDGEFLGVGLFPRIERKGRQAEIGYVIAPGARGRGVATRTLRLLTDWGFAELGLERLELVIDRANTISERVAARAGYVREGVLRSCWVKEDVRADLGIWSRLRTDE